MADAFGTGAGIVGVIGLAIQITQTVVQFGMDWKDAPGNVKTFMAELGTLKTVLSETNTNILLNSDFAEAFRDRPSLLLSQLGPNAPLKTDTKLMLDTCQTELGLLLKELKTKGQGHRLGWERLKGAFLAKDARDSVENLCRQCQTLNNMLSIDAAVLGATTFKEIRDVRREQQEWRQEETKTYSVIISGVDQSNRWQEGQDCQAILDWLTPIDYAPQQSDFINRRQAGTGQWLLDSAEFQTWLNADKQTLFCPGIPGAGKTILTSIVVEELTTRFHNNKSIGIAYFYCNFRRQDEQKVGDLLTSLLKQLTQGRPSLPDTIKSLYDSHKRTRPSIDEISKALQSVISSFHKVFIIIDALDECQVNDGCRTRFMSEIYNLQAKCRVNLFATSRFVPEISENFEGSMRLEIRASEEDVQTYLDHRISPRRAFLKKNLKLQEEIKSEIVKAVKGMFLLAQLHLDSLMGKTTESDVRSAIESLPTGSDAYDQAYEEAMERITEQDVDGERLAKQVLSWITCARRPLTTAELQHAIAIRPGTTKFDEKSQPDLEDMISVCCGLVTVDEESNIVRLVHYTTQEYFERTQKRWFPAAETKITETCITHLLFDAFDCGSCSTDEQFEARLQENILYDYAARNWGHHARAASIEVGQLILGLLESEAKLSASNQAMLSLKSYSWKFSYSQGASKQMTGVHVVAYFGLSEALIALLKNGKVLDAKDNGGRTPLSWAAEKGHEVVVKLLLEKGAKLESKDSYSRTPLLWAAEKGHEAIVKLLLEEGAKLESKDSYGRTLLSWAAVKEHDAVVKLLLQKRAANKSQ